MNWNKNTVVKSDIKMRVGILKEFKKKHKLTEIARVSGNGLNDECASDDDGGFRRIRVKNPNLKKKDVFYKLFRLEYTKCVFLERIERNPDCDSDDVITVHRFRMSKEPKRWKADGTLNDPEFCVCGEAPDNCYNNIGGFFRNPEKIVLRPSQPNTSF